MAGALTCSAMARALVSAAAILLAAVPHGAFASQGILTAVPLITLSYPPPQLAGSDFGNVVFNERFAFLGTDGGLYRVPLPLTGASRATRVAFESTPVTGLAAAEGVLYATLDISHPTGVGATKRSLLKSLDDGVTWTPIDQGLEECLGGVCGFLQSSQIEAVAGRLFVNAGGNVLVSGDEGASWSVLFGASSTGKPQSQACYDPAFALVGQRLLLGGECPLDTAYVRAGTLRPDMLGWLSAPASAVTPPLENRNVQFLRQRGATREVYAGIEGALLLSDDAGDSYRFLLFFDGEAPKYPYITHILFPSRNPSAIVIGGFDKAAGGPYLAVSLDSGLTWTDRSDLLPGAGQTQWSLTKLAEMPDARILVGAEDDQAGMLHLSELRFASPPRRRAARR